MFCGKCGAQNDDAAVVCANCGAPLKEEQPQAANPNSTTIAGITIPLGRNQLIGVAAAVVAVILVVALVAALGGGGKPESVAENFVVQIVSKFNAKAVVEMIPPDVVEELCDQMDMDKKEFIEEMDETLQELKEDLEDEYGKWSVKTEVTKTKEIKRGDVKDLAAKYERYLDIDLDIDEAQEVTVKATVKYGKEEESNKMTITVIKVNGKWYVDYFSLSGIL